MHIVVILRVHAIGQAGVQQHIEMAEFSTLRLTCRPTGVKDNCRIVRVRLDRLKCGWLIVHQTTKSLSAFDGRRGSGIGGHQEEVFATLHFLESREPQLAYWKLRCAFQAKIGTGVRVPQMICDFTRLKQHIERHYHGSCLEDAIVDNREVRDILAT
jgi:hypothetical protein